MESISDMEASSYCKRIEYGAKTAPSLLMRCSTLLKCWWVEISQEHSSKRRCLLLFRLQIINQC